MSMHLHEDPPLKSLDAEIHRIVKYFKVRHYGLILAIALHYVLFLFYILLPQIYDETPRFEVVEQNKWGTNVALSMTIIFHVLFAMTVISLARSSWANPGYVSSRYPEKRHHPYDKSENWHPKPRCGKYEFRDYDWFEKMQNLGITENVHIWIVNMYRDLKWFNRASSGEILNPAWEAMRQQDIDWIKLIRMFERKKAAEYPRYCFKCSHFKPDRSHHCSQCNACVMRMDHHCPYLDNCVGQHNYKFFLLTQFYGALTLFVIIGCSFAGVSTSLESDKGIEPQIVSWILLFTSSCFQISLLSFFKFHIEITLEGITTIECREKKYGQPEDEFRFKICHLKHNKGWYGNFTAIMGSWYLWLIPVLSAAQCEDGFYVPKFKDEAERKDKEEKLDSYAKKRVEQWYSVYKVDPKYSAKDVLKMKYQIKGNRQYNQMIHSGAGDSDQIDKTAESKHDK